MPRSTSATVAETVLDAATRILAGQGRDALTARHLARTADVSPQTIYNRFGSMDEVVEDLLARAYRTMIDDLLDRFGLPLDTIDDPVERLLETFHRYRRFALADPERYHLLFGHPRPDDCLSPRIARLRAEFIELIETVTRLAAAGGSSRIDPVERARRMHAVAHGMVTVLDFGDGQMIDDRASAERYEAAILAVFDR